MNAMGFFKTIVLAGVVLFFALWHGDGISPLGSFVLVATALVFVPWAIYSLVRMAIRPAERRSRAIRIVIWGATIALSLAAQARWDAAARDEANGAVAAVQAHKSRTGSYPEGLSDVGINAQALNEEFSLAYRVHDGKAYLFYSQPSMPMVAHHYNFETTSWERLD